MDANAPSDPIKVRVTVFNQVYNLATTGDPNEVEESARRVDELMTSIARGGNWDTGRIAVLAALHLADQLRALEQASARLQEALQRLDQVLEADSDENPE